MLCKSKEKLFWIVAILWIVLAMSFWWTITWGEYSSLIMNDGDTPLYTSYALNLINCPIGVSHGLMVNALGDACVPILTSHPYNYYLDHPPGMVWILASIIGLGKEPLLFARFTTCALSIGIIIVSARFALQELGLFASIGVFVSTFFIPIFWFHAVSVNLNQAALLLSVLTVVSFIKYDKSSNNLWLSVFLIFFGIGAIIDWPTFFLVGPLVGYLLFKRRLSVAMFFLFESIVIFLLILMLHQSMPMSNNMIFDPLHFVQKSLAPEGAMLLMPFSDAIRLSVKWTFQVFQYSITFLVALLLMTFIESPLKNIEYVLFFVASFVFQAFLNVVLFSQWAATHNYWTYYLIPSILLAAALLFNYLQLYLAKTRIRAFFFLLLTIILMGASIYQMRWWIKDYLTKPTGLVEYLDAYNLKDMLDDSTYLVSETQDPYFHQGFKLRLLFTKQLHSYSDSSNLPCNNVYTLFKLSGMDNRSKARFPSGISLEQFDWFVVPSNLANPSCSH